MREQRVNNNKNHNQKFKVNSAKHCSHCTIVRQYWKSPGIKLMFREIFL